MLYDPYKEEQSKKIQGITDLNERLDYLYEEKVRFRFLNRNDDADDIIYWFDSYIEKTKFKLMHPSIKKPPLENSPHIFKKGVLENFHAAFNDLLWESVDIEIFKQWFLLKPFGQPNFKEDMKSYFCYAVGKIEGERDFTLCPNVGKWITNLIGNTNYSSLKRKATIKSKIKVIDDKLNLFT
ncbi:MAG TPA: hypothetical protein VFG54_00230 [Prolixibacteraceae bacterium]|nr:hypothetical protein [Prolixibacteraceae bacterium]